MSGRQPQGRDDAGQFERQIARKKPRRIPGNLTRGGVSRATTTWVEPWGLLGWSNNRPKREVQPLLDWLRCLRDLVKPVRLRAAAHDE